MSGPAHCLTTDQRIGSYRVVRAIGEGSMGEVYEVFDSTLHRRAALKVVPPSMAREKGVIARFRREARAASQVRHAGVIHIFEYGLLPAPLGSPYFIMEYLEGETLQLRMRRAARQPGGCMGLSCLPFLRQIATALSAVHRRGLVHRDLKPANVMLVADPSAPGGERAKLLDFGIVKILQGDELSPADSQDGTRPGLVLGTPRYMAPEQWKCGSHIDSKTDVYSLGVMAFLGLSGEWPFDAKDAPELGMMHCYKAPPSLAEKDSSLPTVLVELVGRMLEKDPERRPTMAQVEGVLGRLLPRQGLFEKVAGFLGSSDVEISVERSAEGTQKVTFEELQFEDNSAERTQPLVQIRERPTRLMSSAALLAYAQPPPEFMRDSALEPSEGSLPVGSNDNLRAPGGFGSWIAGGAAAVLAITAVYFMISTRPVRSAESAAVVQAAARAPQAPSAPLPDSASAAALSKTKPKKSQARLLPSTACIRNANFHVDDQQMLLRAFVRSDTKLYPDESIVLVNLTTAPRLELAPKSMSRRGRSELVKELQRIQALFTAEVPWQIEIRCP